MATYEYQPRTGELSGDEFEAQTEAFLNDLDQRITAFLGQYASAIAEVNLRLGNLEGQMQGALTTLGSLGVRMDDAEAAIQTLQTRANGHDQSISAINSDINGINQDITAIENNIDTIEASIADIQDTLDVVNANLPPNGLISLVNTTGNLPTGWVACDGTDGTPDLSAYATTPLRYVRKAVAGA